MPGGERRARRVPRRRSATNETHVTFGLQSRLAESTFSPIGAARQAGREALRYARAVIECSAALQGCGLDVAQPYRAASLSTATAGTIRRAARNRCCR